MPPNFDEIDEKEGSNDDSDDAFKISLKSFMKNKRDDAMVNKASHAQKFLNASRLNEA
ncbi:unnamed protein product [Brassica oleracea var. botrytis]|uniref:(rape) hypothetical protein n=1 Tax=Brassica napus TaxID=3708 RepID=A0A816IA44_BRANA|nr:unnamed protein product [Brassica napus]CAF1831387.1 unnamed protein product [Brassica napus]